ncbi:hypothetical protein AAT17_00905 [Nonlabens sp. MIC269]|uniref:flavohemoglobin expression-modulating QEGLA motif protein n=1 Tax=Nonlabens sp. MIC269 TaxID=1476901 RepID=UPI00072279F2|nr:tyrosine/phenylalanine carboxypeptidase domain-containing protein [Nonlabens sp. MIC269]ALM19914.1 hypothetical protein AAT17_00905 [Nonlabens sp. MIC269]
MNSASNSILEIDRSLDRLIGKLELLAYINPQNIAKEKKTFFQKRYNYEPNFKYRKIKFNPYKLHRLFFSQRLERIDNEVIRDFYKDIIYYYSGMIECIETIGDTGNKFYYNSLRYYGTPTEKMVENARFILHYTDNIEENQKEDEFLTTEEAISFFEDYKVNYNFDFTIKTSSAMSASAMVSNIDQALILKRNSKFSKHQLNVLAHHEIGVHLVTTFNALEQPLKVFKNGFPNNVETQEGLAVMAEYMTNNLTIDRLRELAYRVIAVDSLLKGYTFTDTFDLLHTKYKLDRDKAFAITLRVHRGGGFTKDALYLSGLKKIYDLFKEDQSIELQLRGKCSLEYSGIVQELEREGLSIPISYDSLSLKNNLNTNETLDFILKHLK